MIASETAAMSPTAPAAEFVGRDRVCDEIHARMSAGRIVTLVGPGGVGKTRVARQMIAEYGGVFVDLAALSDPELVLAFIAERVGTPETSSGLFESLSRHLARDARLIVLDNCEHMQEAIAGIAQRLVDDAPSTRLLATSRVPLGTRSEFVFPIGPLAAADAHELFCARAREANPTYLHDAAAVARICKRVDYLPLAIALAAVRTKVLPVDALATRLEGRMQLLGDVRLSGRQETIRMLVSWSDELLDTDLRAWFRAVSIFTGGWTDDAAAAITQRSREDAAEAGRALIERSLALDAGDGRTRLFEPMRDFAFERLNDDPERAAIAERHARYYASLVDRGLPFANMYDRAWVIQIEREMDNVRSALTWAVRRGEPGFALRFATALGPFWSNHGRFSEGNRWLVRALETASTESARIRARTLLELRRLNTGRNAHDEAAGYGERALVAAREAGDRAQIAEALFGLAVNAFDPGRYDAAQRSLDAFAELGADGIPGSILASAINLQGLLHLVRGDHAGARLCYLDALDLARRVEDQMCAARALSNLGNLEMYADRLDKAVPFYEESLEIARAFNNVRLTCVLHANLAELGIRKKDSAFAREHAGAEYALARKTGRAIHLASSLETLGEAEVLEERFASAAAIFSHAKRLRRDIGTEIDPVNGEVYESFVARTRAALGDDAFSDAWQRGFELDAAELGIDALFAT